MLFLAANQQCQRTEGITAALTAYQKHPGPYNGPARPRRHSSACPFSTPRRHSTKKALLASALLDVKFKLKVPAWSSLVTYSSGYLRIFEIADVFQSLDVQI